jgi:hypothetical protein
MKDAAFAVPAVVVGVAIAVGAFGTTRVQIPGVTDQNSEIISIHAAFFLFAV